MSLLKLEFKLQVGTDGERDRNQSVAIAPPLTEAGAKQPVLSLSAAKRWADQAIRFGCYAVIVGSTLIITVPSLHLAAEQTEFVAALRRLQNGPAMATPSTQSPSTSGQKIAQLAEQWYGKDFNPGQPAQCAFFVRAVLEEAGYSLSVSRNPVDAHLRQPLTMGTVSGLAGTDIYPGSIWISDVNQVQPGDIVFQKGTYRPDWLTESQWREALTHVGIAVNGGEMVHRPTRARPVVRNSYKTANFAGALRLKPGG